MPDNPTPALLVHNVYFTLNDPSPEQRERLLEAIRTHLTGHPGVVFFAAGTPAEGLDRPVNDLDFHVALHIVFTNRQAHDDYQVSERHQQYIAENKDGWKQVRVFDSVARN
ncbi:MAG: Dabb family protein [Planctomycetaceae bacterium]